MISDRDLERMKREGMNLGDVGKIAKVLSGQSPIARASYVSKCCRGPVDVYHGQIQINPDNPADWAVPIIRRCCLCGKECEGVKP